MNQMRKIIALTAVCLLLGTALLPAPSSAGSLSTSVIGMFPRDIGEFAYIDLKAARHFAWFPQLREQMLPGRFRQFEQFLTTAGIDPNTEVDELAWGLVTKGGGEDIVGVALGQFNPSSAEERFKQQKLPVFDVRGYKLYAFGSGAGPGDIFFFFVDTSTVAFGMRSLLEKMIEVRFGGAESLLRNDAMFSLMSEANGDGVVWAVLNQTYTRLAMQQLLPQASQFPEAAPLVQRMRAMLINVQADRGVDARFQAVCGSPDDANLLAAALQAGVMYRRYQESQANPELAKTLDAVRVTPRGERLEIRIPVSEDQMGSLLRNRTFAVPM